MTPTVFLILTHILDDKVLNSYRKLSKDMANEAQVHLLFHARNNKTLSLPPDISLHSFRDPDLATIGFPLYRKTMVPGSTHYPLMLFARSNPQYEHYWIIEYDVFFSGDWKDFFYPFKKNKADFLTSHIRRFEEEPDWIWWQLTHPNQHIPQSERLRSFNPIYRISASALASIDQAHQSGWAGHYEVLVPTLLQADGFCLNDFGGKGTFAQDGDHDRYYIDDDSSDLQGGLRRGTMRYRPKFYFPGWHKNKLYHPVK